MTISVVQSKSFSQAWTSLTLNSPASAGNSLIIGATIFSTSGAGLSTNSPTYAGSAAAGASKLIDKISPAANNVYAALWLLPDLGSSSASCGITPVNNGSATVVGSVVLEVAGLGASPALDKSASAANTSGTVDSGSSAAITGSPELIVGMAVQFGAAFTPPAGPWTNVNIGGSNDSVLGYQIVTSSGGSYDYPNGGASSAAWSAVLATILGTGGGTPAQQPIMSCWP